MGWTLGPRATGVLRFSFKLWDRFSCGIPSPALPCLLCCLALHIWPLCCFSLCRFLWSTSIARLSRAIRLCRVKLVLDNYIIDRFKVLRYRRLSLRGAGLNRPLLGGLSKVYACLFTLSGHQFGAPYRYLQISAIIDSNRKLLLPQNEQPLDFWFFLYRHQDFLEFPGSHLSLTLPGCKKSKFQSSWARRTTCFIPLPLGSVGPFLGQERLLQNWRVWASIRWLKNRKEASEDNPIQRWPASFTIKSFFDRGSP